MKKTTKLIIVNMVFVILFGILHYKCSKSITFIIVQAILGTAAFWCAVFSDKCR